MTYAIAKPVVPNREWIICGSNKKIGTVTKVSKGYVFTKNGQRANFSNLSELITQCGVSFKPEDRPVEAKKPKTAYDYPTLDEPVHVQYDVQRKLPLYAVASGSASYFCAGYYYIKYRSGWAMEFCPKLLTLDRYRFVGPFKSIKELQSNT